MKTKALSQPGRGRRDLSSLSVISDNAFRLIATAFNSDGLWRGDWRISGWLAVRAVPGAFAGQEPVLESMRDVSMTAKGRPEW